MYRGNNKVTHMVFVLHTLALVLKIINDNIIIFSYIMNNATPKEYGLNNSGKKCDLEIIKSLFYQSFFVCAYVRKNDNSSNLQ